MTLCHRYTVNTDLGTFHINFCKGLDVCNGATVCLEEGASSVTTIASIKQQKFTVDGEHV